MGSFEQIKLLKEKEEKKAKLGIMILASLMITRHIRKKYELETS